MNVVKRFFKRTSHNFLLGALSSFGRSVNRLYENRNHDISSNGELWLITRMARTNPGVIFDVGANTGKYCSQLLKYCSTARIYCFEPVQKTFEMLKASNRSDRVTFIKKGLFKENSQLEINIYPSHTHASLYDLKAIPYETVGKETIELIKGDDFVEANRIDKIDLLKLDIEGSELDALKGLTKAFQSKKVRAVQFEYGYINITTKNLLIDYYEFFEGLNYRVGKLYPQSVHFRSYKFKHEDFIGPNFVAVQKDDDELIRLLS
jgi:FkbM family methyltransferase